MATAGTTTATITSGATTATAMLGAAKGTTIPPTATAMVRPAGQLDYVPQWQWKRKVGNNNGNNNSGNNMATTTLVAAKGITILPTATDRPAAGEAT